MPQVIPQSPVFGRLFPALHPTCSKLNASTNITLNLTISLYDQFSNEETEAQGGRTTGPGPYNGHEEALDPHVRPRGALRHLFLLEPSPYSKAPPQGFLLVHLTSG